MSEWWSWEEPHSHQCGYCGTWHPCPSWYGCTAKEVLSGGCKACDWGNC